MNREEIIKSIKEDDSYAIGALLRLYSLQTQDEKGFGQTVHQNSIGFNGTDSGFLSSLSEHYLQKGWLSKNQLFHARNKVLKYVGQLEKFGFEPMNNKEAEKKEEKKKSVSLSDDKSILIISFPYDKELVSRMKALEGKRFDSNTKSWSALNCSENIEKLRNWGFDLSKLNGLAKVEEIKVDFDGELAKLYPFQKEGIKFALKKKLRCLIGDDMGLGKTVQAIGAVHKSKSYPVVVICPASLKLNWEREFIRWINKSSTVLSGSKPSYYRKSDVYVINYDILPGWLEEITTNIKPEVIVLDECHFIKNKKAKRTKAVQELAKTVNHVIALSGTPIVNRPVELYTTVSILDRKLFPNFMRFATRYCNARKTRWGWDFNGHSNIDELHEILSNSVMIRRKKLDVLKDLPKKVRQVIPLEIDNWQEYKYAEEQFISWVHEKFGREKAMKAMLAETLTKIEGLKQVCVRGKFKGCVQWIKDYIEGGDKLVVFTTHRSTLSNLMEEFKGIAVKLEGDDSMEKRQESIDRFQKDESIKLFIGNLKAAGTGIDGLQRVCDSTCFIEFGWNPGTHNQAEDRVHRIEQKSDSVHAFYLVGNGTIDEWLAKLNDEKARVVASVLDGKQSAEEIEEDMLTSLLSVYKDK